MPTRVVAGILTYNRPAALAECVRTMAAQTHPPDALVIWNNGAAGQAVKALDGVAPPFPVTIHDSPMNFGSTGGYHELVRVLCEDAEATYFYLCDDDIFLDPHNLESLLETYRLVPDERLAGVRGVPPKEVKRRGSLSAPFETKSAGWCGALYRASVLRTVGGPLKELFFCYGEWEWSTRLLSQGYRLMGHPKARFHVVTDQDAKGREYRGPSFRNSFPRIAFYKVRNITYMAENLPHMRKVATPYKRLETYWGHLILSPDKWRTYKLIRLAVRYGRDKKMGWIDVNALVPPSDDAAPAETAFKGQGLGTHP